MKTLTLASFCDCARVAAAGASTDAIRLRAQPNYHPIVTTALGRLLLRKAGR